MYVHMHAYVCTSTHMPYGSLRVVKPMSESTRGKIAIYLSARCYSKIDLHNAEWIQVRHAFSLSTNYITAQ